MGNELGKYETLLNLTRLLYKAYEADRPKPFNLFTVLRSSHDEVNLHSRFLAALLDHQDSSSKSLENLKDLVETVLKIDGQFDFSKARVERERDHIDILVTFGTHQAIVVENKIYAEDQERQLDRYWDTEKKKGVDEIHLVYLTLDGKSPSEESLGSLEESIRPELIGYNSNDFQNWLRNCHQRASGEPELRESIVQYLRLVQDLTGTASKGGYMDALKELLGQGNGDYLRLANELSGAALDLMVDLQNDFWEKLKQETETETGMKLEHFGPGSDLKDDIRLYYTRNRQWYGIRGSVESRNLALMAEISIGYGLICGIENFPRSPQDPKWLRDKGSGENMAYGAGEDFKLDLNNIYKFAMKEDKRREYAQKMAHKLHKMHKRVQNWEK